MTGEKWCAFDWTDARNITQSNIKSGKFDGGHVCTLLNSLETLDLILIEAKVVDEFEAHTTAFKSFKVVTDKCFGQELVSGWEQAIDQFSYEVRKIQDISIILKTHILEAHVVAFLNRQTGVLDTPYHKLPGTAKIQINLAQDGHWQPIF